jgi:hypothetical protein
VTTALAGHPSARNDAEEPIVRFARDELRFPLWPRQAEILGETYSEGIRTAVYRLGRRSGKGRMAATAASYEATVNADAHLVAVPADEQVAIVVVARSQKQARQVHGFIRGFLRRSGDAVRIVRDTVDELELSNGIVIVTLPCHAASARGYAIAVLILDEVAWWYGTDGSPINPKEVWDALRPGTMQFPSRRIFVLSTPRLPTGFFAELCATASSGAVPGMRHWHATTAEVNPTIPPAELEQERALDEIAFRREYEAEFEASISNVFDPATVREAVRERGDLAPVEGASYLIAIDPAYTGDRFTCLVGHRTSEARIVVDRIRAWEGTKAAPVQLDPTLDEIAILAAAYGGAEVLVDQYTGQVILQELRRRGVRVRLIPWTNEGKVDAIAAARRVLYAGRLEIPRHRQLIEELMQLEQHATPAGRPRFAAPGRAHDDYASALLALVRELEGSGRRRPVMTVVDGRIRWLRVEPEDVEALTTLPQTHWPERIRVAYADQLGLEQEAKTA